MKVDKNKYGLVLAGGGGKGGYEIGVWKALRESNTLHIGAVSGTSIGALNATLVAAGDYENAEKLWLSISQDKVLPPDSFSIKNILRKLIDTVDYAVLFTQLGTPVYQALGLVGSGIGAAGVTAWLRKRVINRGIFSREGLIDIIESSGALDKIDENSIPCFATCYNDTCGEIESFCLNKQAGKERKTKILLATSAIPVIYPKEEIDGNEYSDGGCQLLKKTDNVPVKPLYDLGLRKFIAVHLERDGMDRFSEKFQDASFIHVLPKTDIGGVVEALDFDAEHARKRIELGYNDMKHQIEMLNKIDKSLIERNEKAEEIHIYSGKYYDTLNAIIDNSVGMLENANLPDDPDFKFVDLDKELTGLCSRLNNNKKAMDKFVLEGIAHLSTMEAQVHELHRSKGLFKNIYNVLSGKNERLKKGIDNNTINVQKATTELICKLAETDAMGIELIRSVQSQLQGATVKMGRTLEAHGYEICSIKDDCREIAKQYCELEVKDRERAAEINMLYDTFFANTQKTEKHFADIEGRLAEIEDVQRLQNWRMNIKYRSFKRVDYQDLDICEKIVCVVSDFFYFTKGKWDNEIILFVKSALDSLNISPYEIITYNNLISKLIEDSELRNYLFERNGIRIHTSNSSSDNETTIIPHYEAIVNCICSAERRLYNDMDIENWVNAFMSGITVGADLYGNTAFNIACELLVIMSQYISRAESEELLPAYRDIKKAALLGDVDAECKYTGLLIDHNYIDDAFNMTMRMESRVYNNPRFEELKDKVCEAAALR